MWDTIATKSDYLDRLQKCWSYVNEDYDLMKVVMIQLKACHVTTVA